MDILTPKQPKPIKKWQVIVFFIILAAALFVYLNSLIWTKGKVIIGNQQLNVLIADTLTHRYQGWSDRKDMGKYGGMLFVFPDESRHPMVMRDMQFPLDMVWIYKNRVVDIAPNIALEPGVPESQLMVYLSRSTSTLVLELPAGFYDKTGLKIGDEVKIIKY